MKLYLAGPDVFRPDAAAWAGRVRELCRAAGHEALIPLDDDIPATAAPSTAATCSASPRPTRAGQPQSVSRRRAGFGHLRRNRLRAGAGQAVIGYADDLRPLRERLPAGPGADGRWRDAAGNAVEDFGLPLNLMLAVPLPLVQGGVAEALHQLSQHGDRR
jgi:nucleoside 2-deoxyribosyltransferase